MGTNFSKYGKDGAEKFWKKFREDEEFRGKIIKNRKRAKGTNWIREASLKGVKIRFKKQKERERRILYDLRKTQNNISLARLCGFLVGDGSISIRKENNRPSIIHYEINFYPDDLSMANSYIETFWQIYKKKLKIKEEKNHFSVRAKSKIACKHLTSITSFSCLKWKIPNKILNNKLAKKEFLRAFFDCEAYIGKRCIQVQSVNKSGLLSIKRLLKEFDIFSKVYEYERKDKNWNTNYILNIPRKENILKYAKLIGFNHLKKQNKITSIAEVA